MTSTTTVQVTVRYFAAARAAAGNDEETIRIEPGTTVADLVDRLGARDAKLAKVLLRCTFLCDGIAVRDKETVLRDAQTVDVLPPFAGG
ncbi:MoaD/ThiS family protein [Mycolicibacterium pulveris]|uniref:MoaD/ThiS family protein n=1 Tax=Mycolicibacterium pulveris TaxID=36813 RepID=UPI003CF71C63